MKPWMLIALLVGGFLVFLYLMGLLGERIPN